MHDLVSIAYIAAWVGLACFVNRIPFWQPRVLQRGDLSIILDQRPAGCMMVLFLGMGAMIGATLPRPSRTGCPATLTSGGPAASRTLVCSAGRRCSWAAAAMPTCSDSRLSTLWREIIGVSGPQSERPEDASCQD